jgi:beta-aspartyl-peptidase (threonine type)
VEAVEHCVILLEDDPLFNAGCGSVLNEFGLVEMDAGIMDGTTLAAGAVANVRQVRNPIALAKRIMDLGEQVLLIGEGAERLARQQGLRFEPEDYFITAPRVQQLARARRAGGARLDHEDEATRRYSTVGAVARDGNGHLAAATSTGGMTNKRWGRVGDSPLVGAGVYADDAQGAISATGVGEHIIRYVLAKRVADCLAGDHTESLQCIDRVLAEFQQRLRGQAGVIAINAAGHSCARCTTQGMVHGWIDAHNPPYCSIDMG